MNHTTSLYERQGNADDLVACMKWLIRRAQVRGIVVEDRLLNQRDKRL